MLWNIIRDFFVQYIFGGVTSSGTFYNVGLIGALADINDFGYVNGNIGTTYVPIDLFEDSTEIIYKYISIGDWLSTTATIIILCLVILFFIKLTIWFFKQGAGLFKW